MGLPGQCVLWTHSKVTPYIVFSALVDSAKCRYVATKLAQWHVDIQNGTIDMSILIQTTHIYSAIVYLHHGTCTTFHSLTNDNIRSFFFGNPKLLDPVLDGRHVYTDLLVGYPITRKDRRFFKVWVYTSQIWIADWSTFSNHVVKINGCCVFLSTVLLQKQHWITLTWVLPCDFLMKSRFQLCKHREKLYENYVNEITWYHRTGDLLSTKPR